jgi:hypothetical protein
MALGEDLSVTNLGQSSDKRAGQRSHLNVR